MLGDEIILESAVSDLAKKLPSLDKHDYDTIDTLMRKIASKHHITGKALHDLFIKKFDRTPDEWIKDKLDEDGEDQNWRDDPMQWHGSQNDEYEDWYEEQKYKPLRVKVHNVSRMGFQPASGVYTVRNFKKISTTNAEVSVFLQGALVTGIVNLSHPDTHIGRNGRIPNMEFYTDSRPITARQAFNIFQTKLHGNIKKTRKDRPKIEWEPLDEDGEDGPDYIGGNPPPHYDYLEFLSQKPLVMIGTDNEGEEVREIIKEFTRTGPSTGRIGFILNGQMVHMDVPINGDLFLLGNFGLGDLKMNSRGHDLTTREAYNLFQLKKKVKPVKKKTEWEPLDEALSPVKKNKYGFKTNQVEAFFRHLATMTPEQWTSLETAMSQIGHDQLASKHRIADMAAKQNATLRQRTLAHGDAWEAAQGNTATKLAASMATQEIQGAKMFADGMYGEFFFLPMFGFGSPEEIPHANIKKTPKGTRTKTDWERLDEDGSDLDLQSEVDKFVDWSVKRLHIKSKPVVELSMDTEEAQTNHHTGGHVDGEDSIWVYAKNRNLVDILRTTFHELVHVRQGELNMIRPGSSYPGSPIEVMADALAGKWIKIYGEKNHHIFQ